MKHTASDGKYLYPVVQLSLCFRAKFMEGVKKHLASTGLLPDYREEFETAWHKPWVVHCEPSLGKPQHVIGYLGQYIHRFAIGNHRILDIDNHGVLFSLKDYRDNGRPKTLRLTGEEFLRRFCLHILPRGFVKIRYYGIYSSRFRATVLKDKIQTSIKPPETEADRIIRLTGIDVLRCPRCKKGVLVCLGIVPRSRSPDLMRISSSPTTI
jgi:hypothetical protein